MSPPCCTISSRKRLAWRALRETSLMPFLWSSSSSRTTIGRNTSCSSKRKRLVGAGMSTVVSSTKNLVTADLGARADPSRSRLRCMGTSGAGSESSKECRGPSLRGSMGISRLRGGKRGLEVRGLHVVEHFLRVAGDLHAAPFARDAALPVDHEGAALDAAHLLAVHVLHLHHAEDAAALLFGVGEQLEREVHLFPEPLVGRHGVARNPEDRHFRAEEFAMEVAELGALDGAARRVVARVEV